MKGKLTGLLHKFVLLLSIIRKGTKERSHKLQWYKVSSLLPFLHARVLIARNQALRDFDKRADEPNISAKISIISLILGEKFSLHCQGTCLKIKVINCQEFYKIVLSKALCLKTHLLLYLHAILNNSDLFSPFDVHNLSQ